LKDLTLLLSFSPITLRKAQRLMKGGFTIDDIDAFLGYAAAKKVTHQFESVANSKRGT